MRDMCVCVWCGVCACVGVVCMWVLCVHVCVVCMCVLCMHVCGVHVCVLCVHVCVVSAVIGNVCNSYVYLVIKPLIID